MLVGPTVSHAVQQKQAEQQVACNQARANPPSPEDMGCRNTTPSAQGLTKVAALMNTAASRPPHRPLEIPQSPVNKRLLCMPIPSRNAKERMPLVLILLLLHRPKNPKLKPSI